MQKFYSLGRADEEGRVLQHILEAAKGSNEVKMLQEASAKGGRTVRDSACTAKNLQVTPVVQN